MKQTTPDQDAINRSEWENPDNWSSRSLLGLYFSKRDSRVWVPKAHPKLGWTVNLGRPAGVAWLLGLCLAPALILLLVVLASR